jgi:hypothetical protein
MALPLSLITMFLPDQIATGAVYWMVAITVLPIPTSINSILMALMMVVEVVQ